MRKYLALAAVITGFVTGVLVLFWRAMNLGPSDSAEHFQVVLALGLVVGSVLSIIVSTLPRAGKDTSPDSQEHSSASRDSPSVLTPSSDTRVEAPGHPVRIIAVAPDGQVREVVIRPPQTSAERRRRWGEGAVYVVSFDDDDDLIRFLFFARQKISWYQCGAHPMFFMDIAGSRITITAKNQEGEDCEVTVRDHDPLLVPEGEVTHLSAADLDEDGANFLTSLWKYMVRNARRLEVPHAFNRRQLDQSAAPWAQPWGERYPLDDGVYLRRLERLPDSVH